jgi:hypothetical protein
MIFTMVALRGVGGPIYVMPLHEQIPIAVEYLGTEEGDSPKEAYVNWMCRAEKIRLGMSKEAVAKVAGYRTGLEDALSGQSDNGFTLPEDPP